MNQEQIHQITARDEKWVPAKERVKISTTNVRLNTIIQQKEETFQVIIDVIKNSTCYKTFTISAEVPETFMQQFWYTVKKVKDTEYYEFLLANKKCVVDVEVFWKILDICPRVQGVDFAKVPDDEATLTFLLILGYKGPLNKHLSMKLKKGRRENIPYPKFTKININHFLSKHQSLTKLQYLHTHIIKDDGVVSRLKFVRIGEDFQEYGLPILETMLTEAIKQSESYQMFIKYSTGKISPKKSIGKGSQGKKTADTTEETVDVYDSIIPEQDVSLELGKSMRLTEATEEEASRQVYAIHARIVTEPIFEPLRRRSTCIAFRDTSSVSKKMSPDPSQKLKGV
nr:hypothetical protein [Tanacetum cinerariifolium]